VPLGALCALVVIPYVYGMKKVLIGLLLILIAIGAYFGYQWYFTNDNFLRQIYLVPSNAVYVIQTDDPVKNWKKFSDSKIWQHLKQHPTFAGIAKSADALDKFFNDNKTLLGSLGSREFTLSAHITKYNDYDFLFILDLSKASKISVLRGSIENVFTRLGYKVTVRKYKQETVYELFDPADHSTLHLALVANQAVCSYYGALVESAIDEQEHPAIAKENKFIEVEEATKAGGLGRLFINYKHSEEFLRCYMSNVGGLASDIGDVLEYSGLNLDLDGDNIDINGYTNLKDSVESYMQALMHSGKAEMNAYKILPARTATYTSIGCSDFSDFYTNLINVLKKDEKAYKEFEANTSKIEKVLKISLKDNFISWMGDEVAISQNPSVHKTTPEYILTIHADDIEKAKDNLEFIETQIKKRTPAKFETTRYKDHEIHYLEVKGLFNVLLGKYFNKIEKPYYTIIDDYVCFSNQPETIIGLIEDYVNKNTLGNDEGFKAFMKHSNDKSTVFCYINGPRYFNTMLNELKGDKRTEATGNQKYIASFKQTAFSLTARDKNFETKLYSEFEVPSDTASAPVAEPHSMSDQDSLTDVERFLIEQFSYGSIVENYDNGKPKLRAETKDGLKDGRYREYYEDGSVKIKGSYKKGKKDGKWRYYDKDGKLIKKEKYDEGELVDS
jgi:hypothetical protein